MYTNTLSQIKYRDALSEPLQKSERTVRAGCIRQSSFAFQISFSIFLTSILGLVSFLVADLNIVYSF